MYEYKCKIVRVVDGDTVDVDIDLGFGIWYRNQRVRLYGIDTPESRTRDKVEKQYGLMAKAFLKTALGKESTLRTHKDATGKFGRILGEFIVYDAKEDRDQSVKDIMIREHLGVAYFGQSKEDIEEAHLLNRKKVVI
jgi:micrococcal nuclease